VMKYRKDLLPALFLGSGTALTICGLAIMVAQGAEAPIAALALLAAGLLDGVTGLIWTVAVLFSRKDETPGGADGEEARRSLVLASGLLAVIFLGAVLALLLYLHVIVGCLKSWRLL
jgi:hypothetical protein